jgi:hypothetical protein
MKEKKKKAVKLKKLDAELRFVTGGRCASMGKNVQFSGN